MEFVCEIHNKPWIEDGRGCIDCIDEVHNFEINRLKNEIRAHSLMIEDGKGIVGTLVGREGTGPGGANLLKEWADKNPSDFAYNSRDSKTRPGEGVTA